jgi:hypothetical protein
MSGQLLETAPLLGAYVLMAGCYGLFYCLYHLRHSTALSVASGASLVLHLLLAAGIIVWAPLGLFWKTLLAASSAIVVVIPPMTWRFLEHTHGPEGGKT